MISTTTLDWADRVVTPTAIAVSATGLVCQVRTSTDLEADRLVDTLWLGPGDDARRLTAGPGDRYPSWSPDGRTLAFVRVPADSEPRLCTLELETGQVTELAAGYQPVGPIIWAPDGRRLALVATQSSHETTATSPVVISRRGYKADGRGLRRGSWDRVVVLDLTSGSLRELTPAGWQVSSCAWSPAGDRLAFTATPDDQSDRFGSSRAYVVSAGGPATAPSPISPVRGHARIVVWPDEDTGPVWVGRVCTAPGLDTVLRLGDSPDRLVDLLPTLDRNVVTGGPGYPGGTPVPMPGERALLVCVREGGGTRLVVCPLAGSQEPRTVGGGDTAYVRAFAVDPTSNSVLTAVARPTTTGEIERWEIAGRAVQTCTSYGRRAGPVPGLVAPERRRFMISDGTEVAAWLLRSSASTGPAPLLVDLHGGPHNAWSPALSAAHAYHRTLVEAGWTVLLPDPRGSDGYGERFLTANLGRWGTGDAADVLEPVAALVAEGLADPDRLTVSGYSYGGYLTCWLSGHTDVFAATVAGGCIADTSSMISSDSVGQLIDDLEAAPWTDPGLVHAQSPLSAVRHARTPTLLLHGLADETCPPHQAEQWFVALRSQGVPTGMVLYPGASHGFLHVGRPSHRRDYAERLLAWLGKYGSGRGDTDA